MDLRLPAVLGSIYKSNCQVVRVVTEKWAAKNLYCPSCDSANITRSQANRKAVDFTCPVCSQSYQLKSTRRWNENKIVDAAYGAMIAAIRSDSAPNLFLLQYSPDWLVQNILLVPHFFITESAIEKRRPLSIQARRSGWVGCNILLREIPLDGKIRIIEDGVETSPEKIRTQFERIKSIQGLHVGLRGWTLDVLQIVRKLGRRDFNLQDVYQFVPELAAKHPSNRNLHAKIRQQLQLLRDLKFISFLGRGRYAIYQTENSPAHNE